MLRRMYRPIREQARLDDVHFHYFWVTLMVWFVLTAKLFRLRRVT